MLDYGCRLCYRYVPHLNIIIYILFNEKRAKSAATDCESKSKVYKINFFFYHVTQEGLRKYGVFNEEIKWRVWFEREEREAQCPHVFIDICTAHVCHLVVVGAHLN